ncbi:putative vitamin h transporter protein [Eutypa lata UCREL1]|uniref:Putative vitamin h transporter protein n=1 Tax=Eutypa lata (strain UCR-EL1) TaxID=1287681 RepID=M7SMI0_EUTLA|nr:putative vitamin h transporter protein [Eutypa lata UCREL1]
MLQLTNLDNAYVGGLKEDLGFYGNELVQLQTIYVVGAVVGQIPFMFLFTYVPMYWLIPFLDVAWGVFTLLQFRVTSYAELAAYRFLIGWFEAAFFPAMHYVFGSWYRGDEIARRGGIFYVGLSLGTLTAGLIQAEQPNRKVLRQQDIDLAVERLKRAGHVSRGKFQWATMKKVLQTWHFWGIIVTDILFWNAGIHGSAGTFLLWIKSLNRYSTPRVNELGTIAPALGIFYTLAVCFASDLVLGPAWAITIASAWNAIGLVILVIWDVPEAALWFAFSTIYAAVALSIYNNLDTPSSLSHSGSAALS